MAVATRNVTRQDFTERSRSSSVKERETKSALEVRGSRFCVQHEPGLSASRISENLRRFQLGGRAQNLRRITLTLRQVDCVPSSIRVQLNQICESQRIRSTVTWQHCQGQYA